MLGGFMDKLSGSGKKARLKGSAVVLSRKVLDANDLTATVVDNIHEILGNSITCQLISATVTDPNNGGRSIVGSEAALQQWLANLPSLACRGECKFKVRFDWEVEKQGVPGAIIVKNNHSTKFFLKTLTLDHVPGRGTIVFLANSWVYPAAKYHCNRVFFANDSYLPSEMPEGLGPYREDELRCLRGDDKQGPYQTHDRVYRYAVYNDLGEPDREGGGSARPVLGGSSEHPYPRRGRTGRSPSKKDPRSESRLTLLEQTYVPSDERFAHLKMADFAGYSLKAIVQGVLPAIRTYVDLSPGEFDSFKDMMNLYKGGLKLPNIPALNELRKSFPIQLIKELLPVGGDYMLKLPKPDIIKENESAWRTDEEFAREILAGVNPVSITRLTEFPPKSSLDPSKYGDQTSTITAHHVEKSLEGLSVQQALDGKRLYILDHHDHFMPFLLDINSLDGVHAYATRTLLFLRGDDTLKPLAIELSLPLIKGNLIAATSKVYTPVSSGTDSWVWQLAKAYVAVNDSGWHQLVSHWLNTHAVMESFVIATNRQLSVVHPVFKLLQPHYRDTMTINALARQTLINAGGIFEQTVFMGKHSLAISSVVYKDWNFTDQALPDDLIKRGVAVEDPSLPGKVRLLLKDYVPLRHGRPGHLAGHRGVGHGLLRPLLHGRRGRPGRRGAAGVVEGGARGRARRPQGRRLVAGDADRGRAHQGLRHHRVDRVGAPRGRQLRAVLVRGLRPEPADGEPAGDAGAGVGGVRGAGAQAGALLHPHHHQPAADPAGHLAAGDPVQALVRRDIPRAAGHAGVDVGRGGGAGVRAVRREAGADRERGGGQEQRPLAQEPDRPGQLPLHAAVPQHVGRQGHGRRDHRQGHPQQHLHMMILYDPPPSSTLHACVYHSVCVSVWLCYYVRTPTTQ